MISLLDRAHAYRSLLLTPARNVRRWFCRRLTAYGLVFLDDDGRPLAATEIVLVDLGQFCRASKPTVMFDAHGAVDPLSSARMDGRREVYLRLQEALHLDDRVLMQLQHNLGTQDNDR